jgi:hypothetical protein
MSLVRLSRRALIALGVLVAGCAGGEARVSSVLRDPAHPPPPRPAGSRVYFLAAVPPACAADTIGQLLVEGGGPLPSRELTNALSRVVRRMGGDAIVGLRSSTRAAGGRDTVEPRATPSAGALSGTVVRFQEPSCTR